MTISHKCKCSDECQKKKFSEKVSDLYMFLHTSLQATSPWSMESRSWNKNPGEGYELDDYPCEEFHALATTQLPGSVLLQQRLTLLEMLANNWDTG